MSYRIVLVLFCCLLFATHAFPQVKIRGSIKGVVLDTANKQVMASATVSVTKLDLVPKDESVRGMFTHVTIWVHGWYGTGTVYADDVTVG